MAYEPKIDPQVVVQAYIGVNPTSQGQLAGYLTGPRAVQGK